MLDIECFQSNYMKLNEDKCHFLLSGYKHEMMSAKIGQSRIWEGEKQKLLGVTIDKYLKFDEHIVKKLDTQKINVKKLDKTFGKSL